MNTTAAAVLKELLPDQTAAADRVWYFAGLCGV